MADKIALIGVRGSGKTHYARELESKGYIKVSLADPIRKAVSGITDQPNKVLTLLAIPEIYTDFKKEPVKDWFSKHGITFGEKAFEGALFLGDDKDYIDTMTGRTFLQYIADAMKMLVGEDIIISRVLDYSKELPKVVIDDVRFLDEYIALRDAGFEFRFINWGDKTQSELVDHGSDLMAAMLHKWGGFKHLDVITEERMLEFLNQDDGNGGLVYDRYYELVETLKHIGAEDLDDNDDDDDDDDENYPTEEDDE